MFNQWKPRPHEWMHVTTNKRAPSKKHTNEPILKFYCITFCTVVSYASGHVLALLIVPFCSSRYTSLASHNDMAVRGHANHIKYNTGILRFSLNGFISNDIRPLNIYSVEYPENIKRS